MVFGIDFGCLMARFLGPTWPPKSNKIGPKSASRCTSFGTSFLGTLWVRFWDQLGANRTQKLLIFHYVFHVFLKIDLCKLASISNLIWVPTWLHFPPQHRPKSARRWVPRAMQILMEFWIVFCRFRLHSDRFLEPSWEAKRTKNLSKIASIKQWKNKQHIDEQQNAKGVDCNPGNPWPRPQGRG